MSRCYVLENRRAVPCDDMMVWCVAYRDFAARRVAHDTIGESMVSTMFLGVDHSFGEGPPLLFETMVFGGPLDEEQERCSTWEQAEAMHAAMCKRVKAAVH